MITIVDYGMGNLGSVSNMFKRIGAGSEITGDAERISKADKILLPGVGAFDSAMQKINDSGLKEVLNRKALQDKVPILGICLGMQLLTKSSEEGVLPGLGWIDAKTIKFKFDDPKLKIPHMGWNLTYPQKKHPIIENLPDEPRFYFVHSYYVQTNNKDDILANTYYGLDFNSMVQHNNIIGAQFHPEKSHKFGMKLLENFALL
jgi:glutamine amidotransferase